MAAPKNTLKAALSQGEVQLGIWLALVSPAAAEIAAEAGFDWALIDAEHGPNDVAAILAQLQAMGGGKAAPVVRVPSADDAWIKRVLDLGVQTILVPMVDTPEQAAEVVAATRYPPDGKRGSGAVLARATGYGAASDYVTTANDEMCVIVQVESQRALQNIDAIARTDGVDCVFVGPSDLSNDMGYPGNPSAPNVVAAIDQAIDRIRVAGKVPGIVTFDRHEIAPYVSKGVTFLGVGGDALLLGEAMRDLAQGARVAAAGE
ncbi:MAG: HpcH/HpaI aldolase/citrate lyase family protein [Pseudomonadota bacterium]